MRDNFKSSRNFIVTVYLYNISTHFPNCLQSRLLQNTHTCSTTLAIVENKNENPVYHIFQCSVFTLVLMFSEVSK